MIFFSDLPVIVLLSGMEKDSASEARLVISMISLGWPNGGGYMGLAVSGRV
jgi:hypothetical protein